MVYFLTPLALNEVGKGEKRGKQDGQNLLINKIETI